MEKLILKRIFILVFITQIVTSCSRPYKEYANLEVVLNSYTGEVKNVSGTPETTGSFNGENDSGIYCFAWENDNREALATVSFEDGSTGILDISINEAKGKEILSQDLISTTSYFEGTTGKGKSGMWLVTLEFKNFSGSGTFSIDTK